MVTMSAGYMRKYRARKAAEQAPGSLLPFQAAFVAAVCRKRDPPTIAALSCPRGNGKSWLCGKLVARSITPGDVLFEPGCENILVSGSRAQASIVLEFSRAALGESDAYRWSGDGVIHKDTRTRVRVLSSDSRRAYGLGASMRIVIADEPGAWAPTAGQRLWNAILTSLGKGRTTIVAVGTLAPAPVTGPGAWWPRFVKSGTGGGRHVSLLQADPDSWRDFQEVLRVNPVSLVNPYLKQALEREHAAALESDGAARVFRMYRLNLPGGEAVDTQPLLSAAEWDRVTARAVPEIEGRPIVGVDLGGSRSWSAACALWPSGRIECWAICPGRPSLAEQEKADAVPGGSYAALVKSGGLEVDAGRSVPRVERLLARIWQWKPAVIVADLFRAPELAKASAGRVRVIERARGGGETESNVQALRSLLLDSPAGVVEESKALLGCAFAQTALKSHGDTGEMRVSKLSQRRSRDDAAAALLLAAGELARRPVPVQSRVAIVTRMGW